MIFAHVLVHEIVSTAMWLAESSLLIRLSTIETPHPIAETKGGLVQAWERVRYSTMMNQ